MKALSIKQPWAFAIMALGKDIENRDWLTKFRGTIAVHASKGMTGADFDAYRYFCAGTPELSGVFQRTPGADADDLQRGAILGTVEIIDCVSESNSPWFVGDYGFELANPRILRVPIPCKGALGLWDVPIEIERQIEKGLIEFKKS